MNLARVPSCITNVLCMLKYTDRECHGGAADSNPTGHTKASHSHQGQVPRRGMQPNPSFHFDRWTVVLQPYLSRRTKQMNRWLPIFSSRRQDSHHNFPVIQSWVVFVVDFTTNFIQHRVGISSRQFPHRDRVHEIMEMNDGVRLCLSQGIRNHLRLRPCACFPALSAITSVGLSV